MVSSHRLCPFLVFSSVLFSHHIATATRFTVSESQKFKPDSTPSSPAPIYLPLSPLSFLNQVFGFSRNGLVTATLNFSVIPQLPECSARLSLCLVSEAFVRGPNYQRRQTRAGGNPLIEAFTATTCDPTKESEVSKIKSESGLARCHSDDLCSKKTSYTFSVEKHNLQPNEMYFIGAALCNTSVSDDEERTTSLTGQVEFRNPDLLFPQLGFEEVLFPVFSASIVVMLALSFVVLILALLVSFCLHMPFRFTVRFVIVAIFLKLLGAILTFVHFYTLAQTGTRQVWYLYVRLLLASSADIFFIIAFISISSGYAVMPNSWFVEDRSPIFLVYIGVVLQLLIIIAVKIMFPFRYLGAVTYAIAGSSIALIACISSYRNSRFLYRFGHLIQRSHIFLKSTPISQLRIFYLLNVGIVTIAYLIKIISVGLFDYGLNRPDLLWGTMETVDAVMLVWYAAFVFPRPKSPLYVDMSNLSNQRLHQAERWRDRQLARQASNDDGDNETTTHVTSGAVTPAVLERRNESSSAAMPGSNDSISDRSEAQGSSARVRVTRRAQRLLGQRRVRQNRIRFAAQPTTGSEAQDLGREVVDTGLDPEPLWIAWTSGASLPRPNSYTWRGRHTDHIAVRQDGNVTPFLRTPIVVGSPEDSSDVVKLTVGVPVAGTNAIPKTFDEKGAEITESSRLGSSPQSPTSSNDHNRLYASGASRMDLGARFGLSTRRQNRVDQRGGEAFEQKGIQTQRLIAREAVGSSSQALEAGQDSEMAQITRNLSASTTATCSDGVVSNLAIG